MRYLRLSNGGEGPIYYGATAFDQVQGTGGY